MCRDLFGPVSELFHNFVGTVSRIVSIYFETASELVQNVSGTFSELARELFSDMFLYLSYMTVSTNQDDFGQEPGQEPKHL